MGLEECRTIHLPKVAEIRGNLSYIESNRHVPFEIKRVYYIYDVPGGADRGGHAHKRLQQFVIAISGSFDVVLDDGRNKQTFHLNRSFYGLYISTMVWREINNFSSGSVCLALASEFYDEVDYFRDYDQFVKAVEEGRR